MAVATKAVKKRSAAEIYAEKTQAAAEQAISNWSEVNPNDPLFDLVSPTGMEWKVRRPNIQLFIDAGILPASLASKLYLATKQTPEQRKEMLQSLSYTEAMQSIGFNAAMVRYICVDPRIVETPKADDEVGFDQVTQGDFDFLTSWAIKGGEQAAGLENFPGKRPLASLARSARKGNGKAGKRTSKAKR